MTATATARRSVRPGRSTTALVALAVAALVLVGTTGMTAAGPAQTDPTLPPGGVTATQADDDEGPGPNAGGTTGLVVLLIVMGIIGGGATILYVKHRPR